MMANSPSRRVALRAMADTAVRCKAAKPGAPNVATASANNNRSSSVMGKISKHFSSIEEMHHYADGYWNTYEDACRNGWRPRSYAECKEVALQLRAQLLCLELMSESLAQHIRRSHPWEPPATQRTAGAEA